jgi:hypothetical protein
MLSSLELVAVGPAPRLRMELAPRLNVLTGDNGLGKTFLLDVAWWAHFIEEQEATRPPDYWSEFRGDLALAFQHLCAYCAPGLSRTVRIGPPLVEGAGALCPVGGGRRAATPGRYRDEMPATTRA